jgi:hypothetical protein
MATAQVYWYFVCRKRHTNSHHQKKLHALVQEKEVPTKATTTMVATPLGRYTELLPAGASFAIAATAPVTLTIAMEGPSGDAIYARIARCSLKLLENCGDVSYNVTQDMRQKLAWQRSNKPFLY